MRKELFAGKNVIVQGITGKHGSFHTVSMQAAGTNIVAGTSPNKTGQVVNGVPVYTTIQDIKKDHQVDASIIFVPAPFAKAAMLEAIQANVPLIICITEGIPIHDMLIVKKAAQQAGITIIGPNSPGVLMPGGNKLGIIPAQMGIPGNIAIVSRSGTLTYEVTASLTAKSIGQKYIIGIGGDPVRGVDFVDCLKLFENDDEVNSVVLIGEIGGDSEQLAAEYIKNHGTKPAYAYIAGQLAPEGVQLGHAGAILRDGQESAAEKMKLLQAADVTTALSIDELIQLIE